ncbi:flippase [Dyadobacter sandarakinus]|uniref:Flippase n=1 Tax=Dyadobacter sandarakinus TaxID=2747268 RepID=A0ABX7IC53_9BACT|nr:flippase [Dyadobacter sandarakinus]QRR03400.1 flippase [Dyadobacter sandarakinus]
MRQGSILSTVKTKIRNPVFLNIFWLSFDKVFKLVVGLVVGIWVARYLGPTQWGELNFVNAFVTIMIAIAKLGLDGFLVKEFLQHPEDKNAILGTSFTTRLLISPILIIAVALYFYYSGLDTHYYWLLAFLSLNVLITPFDLIDLDFQSKLQSKLTVISKNVAYVLGAFVRVYFLIAGKSLIWFAAAMGIEAVLSYFLLTLFYQKENNIFAWKFSFNLVKRLLSKGWPFTIASLAIVIYIRIDQIMVGSMVGEEELGLFSSAIKISDIFTFLPMAVAGSYLPSLMAARSRSWDEFITKMQNFLNWMARISILTALLISLFSDVIIRQLYGEEYMLASPILIIHIWSLVPIFLGVSTTQYLVIENLQKFSLYRTLIGLVTNLSLNFIMIPAYGAYGAAIAATISQLVASVFSMSLFPKTRKLFGMQMKSVLMIFRFS